MTDQQREKLNRFLAEKVLGWVEGELNGNRVYRSYEGCEMFVNAWHPCELLRYCEPLLDAIEQYGWLWDWSIAPSGRYWVTLKTDDICHVAYADTRTEAICLAIGRTYGWKEV